MAFAPTAGKSSGYDYAVVRFDLQANVERIWVEQADLECAVVDRTLATWNRSDNVLSYTL
jgi:hypothetical protein